MLGVSFSVIQFCLLHKQVNKIKLGVCCRLVPKEVRRVQVHVFCFPIKTAKQDQENSMSVYFGSFTKLRRLMTK